MVISTARILIIDDDKLIRWSLKEIFSEKGHKVDTAAAPDEALGLAAETQYNLIFADLELNEADGIEMLKKINDVQPEAKIIILSAMPVNQVETQLAGLAVFAVVEKPFDSDKIRDLAVKAMYSNHNQID
jgi:DNA-binding NtrC family response regulator